jgi:outer membrane protein
MQEFFMRHILAGILMISALAPAYLTAAETAAPAASPAAAAAPAPATATDGTATPAAGKRFRVGYVDTMKVAEQSDAGKVAKTHFEAKADRHKAQIDTKQKLLEKQKATLEAKLPTYTPEQRAAKIKDYEKKVEELRKLLQKADSEMKPMQEELIREIYGKIEKAAREYGAANGFAVIIEKRELLYLGSNVDAEDVTAALIDELNRK